MLRLGWGGIYPIRAALVGMTCASCKHALPVDPNGYWRTRHNDYATTHVHCSRDDHPYGSVLPKVNACQFEPTQWEALDGV
jgi:hypothetical protein